MPELHIDVDNDAPAHGDTVTATFSVTGNDGTPRGEPVVHTLVGEALFDGTWAQVSQTITLPGGPGVPPVSEEFLSVTVEGLTFTQTDEPAVWTAVVP